jgi:hypothetical protein
LTRLAAPILVITLGASGRRLIFLRNLLGGLGYVNGRRVHRSDCGLDRWEGMICVLM